MLGCLTNLRVLCTQIKTEHVFTWIQSERKQCDINSFPFFNRAAFFKSNHHPAENETSV